MFPYANFQGVNPYQQLSPISSQSMPPQTVTRLSGIESARQLKLAPNSSMLALDYDDVHVYAIYSDGAGMVTVKPFTLSPCEERTDYVTVGQFESFKEEINEHLSRLKPAGPQPDTPADKQHESRRR